MADWDSRETCLSYITTSYNAAWSLYYYATSAIASLYGNYNGCSDPVAVMCFGYTWTALSNMIMMLRKLIGHESAYDPEYAVPYFLSEYTTAETAEEYELSWEKIVAAWADADTVGRLWTILSIDFMRKEVWDEPVTTFMMRSGKVQG